MSAHNFTFPPPPPPPPKAASLTYPAYVQPSYLQENGSGGRAGRGSRGRGRGDGHRGSRGGMFRGQGSPSSFSAGSPRDGGYFASSSSGYSRQIHTNSISSYPLPEYPQEQPPQYRPQHNGFAHYAPLGSYPQPPAFETPQPTVSHHYSSNSSATPYTNGYRSQSYGPPQAQSQAPPSQPTIMGPPIRMGFDNDHPGDYRSHTSQLHPYGQPDPLAMRPGSNLRYHDHGPRHRQRTPNLHNSNRHFSPNHFTSNRSQGPKRGTSTAVQRPPSSMARPQAAPAVPSFGIPLPMKPPAPSDSGKKPRKKKRKHNQLGLTPKAEEHESSEEEEDVDEEAKLAAMVGAVGSDQKQ